MRKQGDLIELTTSPNEAQAGILRSVLEDAGIESQLSVGGGVMANAEFGMTFVPTSIWVKKEDLERARAVLDDNRSDSVDIDWDEVDVGEPEGDAPVEDSPEAARRRSNQRKFFFVILAIILVWLVMGVVTGIAGRVWNLY